VKIRDKLFLGFGLYIMLAVILGSFAYKEIRKIGTRLSLVETADDITNAILEVRRYEKNFLLYRDPDDFDEMKKYLTILKDSIEDVKAEVVGEINMIDERDVPGAPEDPVRGGRRSGVPDSNYERMKRTINDYERLMDVIAKNANAQDTVKQMRRTAREIQSFTQNLAKRERANVAAAISKSINLVIIALVLIVLFGTIINIKLATSIAAPIRRLEKITKRIAKGDFSETIEEKGKDELASLAISFNLMAGQLKHALRSLENTIQQLKDKQAQLVEAEKLAAVGKLAAGIAHEINNPLTSVLTFSNLMLEQCPREDPRYDKLRLMARETDRARNIVRQLLSFGREVVLKPQTIDLNAVISDVLDSLTNQDAFKGIELTKDFANNLPPLYADPAQISQVAVNMLLNAIHAITPPGSIGVATRSSGGFAEIVFSDSGSGISEEHLGRIFDPFFTTKDMTKGTGLGLAVSYGIIKKHNGDIEVSSVVGKGTTFTVRLPING
jgi:two-component system NtrC family sensor kinase